MTTSDTQSDSVRLEVMLMLARARREQVTKLLSDIRKVPAGAAVGGEA